MTRSIRVAVIDSGVHVSHPHVEGVSDGIGIDYCGVRHDDYIDRLGHGTAVTAAIREKAPAAEIVVAKVFDRDLSATGQALVAACDWALEQRSHIVNLSLGTTNVGHTDALAKTVAKLRESGAIVVAAGAQDGVSWLPGILPGVWSVTLDWSVPREECRVSIGSGGDPSFRASGFPRPIPGVTPERNLKGLSFAVANVTGLLAALFDREGAADPAATLSRAVAAGWMGGR